VGAPEEAGSAPEMGLVAAHNHRDRRSGVERRGGGRETAVTDPLKLKRGWMNKHSPLKGEQTS